ncbi:MAG TPA: subclass B1 metallo-beta-lactamase [Thermoanaerobaculia bacterium]|nr:subclass B1 metallo-beta-lactamase [Thermoanaerobaculia bacterium]
MRKLALSTASFILWSSALLAAAPPSLDTPDVKIRQLEEGVFLHVTTEQSIEANGLVVKLASGYLLVDTGWRPEQTEKILAWGDKELGGTCAGVVVTHSHSDRSGGLAVLAKRGIPILASESTANALRAVAAGITGVVGPKKTIADDPRGFTLFYPGPAHSPDNIVVYFPSSHVLFGGCLVRPAAAKDLGTTTDANLGAWPETVKAVGKRFPKAALVVPGHGAPGTKHLLTHTLALLAKAPAPASPAAPAAPAAPATPVPATGTKKAH